MPAVFAHDLYGRRIFKKLPREARQLILREKDCFYLGLQGPDPLFFYRPVGDNPVRLKGNKIHDGSGAAFFHGGIQAVQEEMAAGNIKKAESFKAYLLGFGCHYALDSSVHAWINRQHVESPYTHTDLETELDRRLMAGEGYVPLRTDRACHIKNTARTRQAGARFFGETEETLWECLLLLRLFNRLFVDAPEPVKAAVCESTGWIKDADMAHGMFMRKRPSPGILPYAKTLENMYWDAFPAGEALVPALWEAMEEGKELPKRFLLNFNGVERESV